LAVPKGISGRVIHQVLVSPDWSVWIGGRFSGTIQTDRFKRIDPSSAIIGLLNLENRCIWGDVAWTKG
jgi:hypothetical protein